MIMKTIAIEEHYWHPGIKDATTSKTLTYLKGIAGVGMMAERLPKLDDLHEIRLKDMDEAGIDFQVL